MQRYDFLLHPELYEDVSQAETQRKKSPKPEKTSRKSGVCFTCRKGEGGKEKASYSIGYFYLICRFRFQIIHCSASRYCHGALSPF